MLASPDLHGSRLATTSFAHLPNEFIARHVYLLRQLLDYALHAGLAVEGNENANLFSRWFLPALQNPFRSGVKKYFTRVIFIISLTILRNFLR